MKTIELTKTWLSTGIWNENRGFSVLTLNSERCKGVSREAQRKDERIYLFITDLNPELEELSMLLS